MRYHRFVVCLLLSAVGWAQQASSAGSSSPSLTIYNQNFAVVREFVPLQLNAGVNQVSFDGITSFVEPSSVVLRDPTGRVHLSILEQNYRTDVASQQNLLRAYEGKEIEFQNGTARSFVGGLFAPAEQRIGNGCYGNCGYSGEIIVEVDGKIQFGLPGTPIFPALQNEALLNPALNWLLQSDRAAQVNAEISYITGGLTWEASYNVIAPETGDVLDMVGWITFAKSQRTHLRERSAAADGRRGKQDHSGHGLHGQVAGGRGDQRRALSRTCRQRKKPSTNITSTRSNVLPR